MASNNNSGSNKTKHNLGNMKYEVANELGINLKQGDNGNLTSREAGYIGGYMVKKLIDMGSNQFGGSNN